MANYVLTPGQDILVGTPGDDVFFANGTSLNPGDQVNGGGGFDIFDFSGNTSQAFSGFQLNGIERFQAFVASGANVDFDMSGSNNVAQLILRFAEGSARWQNVDLSADDIFALETVGTASLFVDYVPTQVTGINDTVNVFVDSAGLNELDIEATNNSLDIENLNITALDGSTVINDLDSFHQTLNLFGSGDFTINQSLQDSIRTIDASGMGGDLDINFNGNDGAGEGVTVIGSAGVNTIEGGTADHTITTFDARDKVVSQGGDDVISTGGERDKITIQNAGTSTLDGGDGNDVFDLKGDLDALDVVAGGAGNDELRADGGVGDGVFANKTSIEIYTQNEGGSSTLGAMAQAAGVDQIRFDRTGNENDTINAANMTNDLKFVANYANSLGGGGSDTLTGGLGDDLFNMAAGFGGEDQIAGGAGFDEIKVRGDTFVGGNDLSGVELVTLGSHIGGKPGEADGFNIYHFDLTDASAPDAGATLTIDGTELAAGETLIVNDLGVTQVTMFSLNIFGGAADDPFLYGGGMDDIIDGGAGEDNISGGAGSDEIAGGLGADTLTGGTEADVFNYTAVAESAPSATGRDEITDFTTGEDVIDLLNLAEAAGLGVVDFVGEFTSVADAQANVDTNSGDLQVAYVTGVDLGDGASDYVLVDSNDDGVLNGDDLQIEVSGAGVGGVAAADVQDGMAITATAAPAPAMPMGADFLPQEVNFPAGDGMMAIA